MTQSEIIEAIKVLNDLVNQDKGFLLSKEIIEAKNKIRELIPLINAKKDDQITPPPSVDMPHY